MSSAFNTISSKGFLDFLPFNKRFELIDVVFLDLCSKEIINFLKILIQNKNLVNYENIFNNFLSLFNKKKHVLNGIVYSTILLSSGDICTLEKKISFQEIIFI